jgi:glycerophosphoryl diester phosphodiesterase
MATLVWAHRGASAYAPENTLSAFEKAIQMGSDGIELDVHMCLDGELVVIHDETVDRTSNGTGAIADMTLEQLKKLDFSNGFTNMGGQASLPCRRCTSSSGQRD